MAVAVAVAVEAGSDVVAVVGSGVALVVVAAAVGNAMQVADGDAAEPVPTSDTEEGIGVSAPVGNSEEIEKGANDPPTGVPVGRPNTADAGQVLASSRNWTTGWPLAVTTSAPAATSCAPGNVATKASWRPVAKTTLYGLEDGGMVEVGVLVGL